MRRFFLDRVPRATKNRRWLLRGGIALLILIVIFAVGASRWGKPKEDLIWERIQREGVLRVGMDASFPPFGVVNEAGEFAGYDVDLARELAHRLGITDVAFINIHFDGLYDALLEAKCDVIISALPYDRDLTEDVAYSLPYFQAGQMLLAREGEANIHKVSDLGGKSVAVELGSEAHYVAYQLQSRKAIPLQILTYYTAAEALDALRAGKAQAAIADAVTAYSDINRHGGLQLIGDPLTDEPYVIAMPLDSPRLRSEINRALAALAQEGYLEKLRDQWLR